jgi:hypothetical protein
LPPHPAPDTRLPANILKWDILSKLANSLAAMRAIVMKWVNGAEASYADRRFITFFFSNIFIFYGL